MTSAAPPASARFALAWLLPLGVGVALWREPASAGLWAVGFQVALAVLERLPVFAASPPPQRGPKPWFRTCLRVHAVLQAALLGLALALAPGAVAAAGGGWDGAATLLSMAVAVGTVTGSQGITYAHELGHSRRRADRVVAWLLMGSVAYAHFMVEHYRGHHPRAATHDDPATARRGESLWRFLPRTLAGSWRSAWTLERRRLAERGHGWRRSPLAWAVGAQGATAVVLAVGVGPAAAGLWLLQAAHAVFLLETVNYIEHYGLQRAVGPHGRPVPFGVAHAWNADAAVTNAFIANLQRHSDHHLHAWKPYETLEALPGPQLPTGYAGCLFLAMVPPLWFARMHPRLDALPEPAPAAAPSIDAVR